MHKSAAAAAKHLIWVKFECFLLRLNLNFSMSRNSQSISYNKGRGFVLATDREKCEEVDRAKVGTKNEQKHVSRMQTTMLDCLS